MFFRRKRQKVTNMNKCEYCRKEGQDMIDINNYVVTYESWEGYNCCCEDCAKQSAIKDGIHADKILSIE